MLAVARQPAYHRRVKATTHLRASLVLTGLFLATGLLLEAALGGRLAIYVDDPIRREFLRLGHAHGGLLSIANLALAYGLDRLQTPEGWARPARWAAWLGALAVGIGFMSAGIWHAPTDPGPTVLLVPAGALSLLMALAVAALVRPGDRAPGEDVADASTAAQGD